MTTEILDKIRRESCDSSNYSKDIICYLLSIPWVKQRLALYGQASYAAILQYYYRYMQVRTSGGSPFNGEPFDPCWHLPPDVRAEYLGLTKFWQQELSGKIADLNTELAELATEFNVRFVAVPDGSDTPIVVNTEQTPNKNSDEDGENDDDDADAGSAFANSFMAGMERGVRQIVKEHRLSAGLNTLNQEFVTASCDYATSDVFRYGYRMFCLTLRWSNPVYSYIPFGRIPRNKTWRIFFNLTVFQVALIVGVTSLIYGVFNHDPGPVFTGVFTLGMLWFFVLRVMGRLDTHFRHLAATALWLSYMPMTNDMEKLKVAHEELLYESYKAKELKFPGVTSSK